MEDVYACAVRMGYQPGGDLLPQALIRVFARAPIMRPPAFLLLSSPLLFQQRWSRGSDAFSRKLFLATELDRKRECGSRWCPFRRERGSDGVLPESFLQVFQLVQQAQGIKGVCHSLQFLEFDC